MAGRQHHGLEKGVRAVLVVEDEFLIALEVEDMLSRAGYGVIGPAQTVAEALGLLELERPGVALLDVNLRGERVSPVAEALTRRGIPFFLTSAYQTRDLRNDPILADAENLGKPLREQALIERLARVFEREPAQSRRDGG